MKKIIIILFVISCMFLYSNKGDIIIPNDSVRFRIIANSNSFEDQSLKKEIKKDLIDNVFSNIKSKKDIINNIPTIDNRIKKYNIEYDISYGMNYFPQKEYKGITYPKGNYESLVITLKDGLGDNYWCVMYPPLCLIDDTNTNDVEYKLLVKEIIDKNKNNVN